MKKSQKQALAIGVGAAALAAAATGVYFLTGKRGAKTRRQVSAWADKAKREVIKELKQLKKIDSGNYQQVIDKVTKRYKKLGKVDTKELAAVAKELKGRWAAISKAAAKPVRAKARPKGKSKAGSKKKKR
jgi:hypothetical protein